MERLKPIHLLAGLGWLNFFALCWVLILDRFPFQFETVPSFGWLVFFFVFAFLVSAATWEKKQ